jgi:threonine aldolase
MAFPDGTADFRSDTVTRPTPEMRRAMADAEVGDDVYGEDPTVNVLQEEAAAIVGKQAALFVPSGTMANQSAVKVHTDPGDEVLSVDWAHVRNYERGAAAFISSIAFRTVPGDRGTIAPDEVRGVLKTSGRALPKVSLLVWENTHNAAGGTVIDHETMLESTALAREGGMAVHLDGARIFNAVAASGRPAADLAAPADTVMFCFSKGLGAPVGSILCGSRDLITAAHEIRKRLGGGMRQAGVIAAAARVALRDRDRLAEDHALAASLAAELADRFPGGVPAPDTNMVLLDGTTVPGGPEVFRLELEAAGVLVGYIKPGILRFVTHRDVGPEDVARVAAVASGLAG